MILGFGIRIVSSPYAETTRTWHTVERAGIRKKRRKNWRVMRHTTREPAAYQTADGTVVAHPKIIAQIKREYADPEKKQ